MTREELIEAIYNSDICPKYSCDKPEEEGNTGECCKKCAEVLLAEYEKQIRADVIDVLTQKVEIEEKWLFDCYAEMGCRYTRRDVNIAFSGIKHFLNKLKGE